MRRRRLFRLSAIAVASFLLLAIVLFALVKAEPAYYSPITLTPLEFETAAQKATDKLIELRNVAAETRARSPSVPVERMTVTFTQQELNAFFLKWAELHGVRARLEESASNSALILHDGKIILAGRATVRGIQTVLSISIRPRLDEGRRLSMAIEAIRAGRLPLPSAVLDQHLHRSADSIRRNLPRWNAKARIENGAANNDALSAVYSRIMLAALTGESVEPVLLIPLLDSPRAVAVELTEVAVGEGTISLTVRALTSAQGDQFEQRLRADR